MQYALRDGTNPRMSCPLHIYRKHEITSVRQFAVRFLHSVVEVGLVSHIHAGRLHQSDVIDSLGRSFG